MSFPQKTTSTNGAATLALWRAAESGDVDELASVLSRVPDINARNEHGVTALMRAAQQGHLKAVRVLLEHGADANITRNDKFTALALAAFFGHTEVVRMLMEHGADSKASTRSGTSPHMWATARTFNEVVDQLQNPSPPKAIEPLATVKPKPQVVRPFSPPPVVRTLKDPPEIWDLVHEVPKGFDARSAFMSRLNSMQKGLAFRIATVAVLIGGLVAGVMVLRRVQAGNEKKRPIVVSSEFNINSAAPPAAAAPVAPPSADVNAAVEDNAVKETALVDTNVPPVNERASARATFNRSHRVNHETTPRVVPSEIVQPVVTTSENLKTPVQSPPATATKVSAPLSPQLIAPAKSAGPKSKVIQWP